jgi:hypothetical protein
MSEDTTDDESKLPIEERRKQKFLDGFGIYTTAPTSDNLAFIARELVLCTLPHSDPGNVPAWSRKNGNLTLGIQPGFNFKTGKSYGYPYGTIPRLLLVWIVTEILRTKSRHLELGIRLTDFMATLGLNTANGSIGAKRSDARRLREQMERLFRSTISFEYSRKDDARSGKTWLDMQVAPEGTLWWSEKDPDTTTFGSWIVVGEKFYQAVMANPYPLDIRVLRHIKNSALGIDLYTILNREAFRASKEEKPRFMAWEWLHAQTGNECADIKVFRRNSIEQLKQILEVHSGLIVSVQAGRRGQRAGLIISNLSTPSIRAEQFRAEPPVATGIETTPPTLTVVAPTPAPIKPQLKPATIEGFRERYPHLAPDDCKYAFDVWLEGKGEDNQPKHYDKAFLSFASKWIKGKF